MPGFIKNKKNAVQIFSTKYCLLAIIIYNPMYIILINLDPFI